MVTYEALFIFITMVVSIIALVVDITTKKEINRPSQKCGLFLTTFNG